jgi:hypothetical protein
MGRVCFDCSEDIPDEDVPAHEVPELRFVDLVDSSIINSQEDSVQPQEGNLASQAHSKQCCTKRMK